MKRLFRGSEDGGFHWVGPPMRGHSLGYRLRFIVLNAVYA